MYFDAPVKMKGKEKYFCEVNIDDSYADMNHYDEWGAAYVFNRDGNGAEYNICYDGRNECSAIYKLEGQDTDTSTYEHYEIDFSMDDWKERLINRMIECVEEWFGDED